MYMNLQSQSKLTGIQETNNQESENNEIHPK